VNYCFLNRHMASRGFGHGRLGRASVGRGRGYQDFPLLEARALGITFSRVTGLDRSDIVKQPYQLQE
jgi:hypothetical protein